MGIISGGNIMPGSGGLLQFPGAPGAGTDEVQTVTVTPDDSLGGTYRLNFEGGRTTELADDAAAAAVQAALRALPTIGGANVTVAGSAGGPYTVTFVADFAKKSVSLLTAQEKVDVAVAIVRTTPGVDASGRGAPKGAQAVDISTGILYSNIGTELAPSWQKVGLQT